jgi:drug/metabolite transporter (DMT)-like permease
MRLKSTLVADAALMATTLIWGSTFVVAKDILERWPPIAYIALRFALAALVLAALFPQQIVRARVREWKAGVGLGLLMGGSFAVQAVGLVYTTPSKSAFIAGLTTPLVPFVALLLLRVRPALENLIGVVLASIGGLLILAPQGASGSINPGDFLSLVSSVLFALHITLMSVYARRFDVRQLTALQITTAALFFIIFWLLLRAGGLFFAQDSLPGFAVRESAASLVWSGRVVWQLVYLSLIATVLTFLLWTWGQARVSATHAAIIFSLEPVFATIAAIAVRGTGEWMGGRASFGAILIFAGVIISELRLGARREKMKPEVIDDDQDISLEA